MGTGKEELDYNGSPGSSPSTLRDQGIRGPGKNSGIFFCIFELSYFFKVSNPFVPFHFSAIFFDVRVNVLLDKSDLSYLMKCFIVSPDRFLLQMCNIFLTLVLIFL